ncbi:FMN-dependent dehydrogenase-domain-containing protein [Aspergillus desertorum]
MEKTGTDVPLLPVQDVISHNPPDDCWVVIQGEVWDLTAIVNEHPGGPSIILKENISTDHFKGRLDTSTSAPGWTQVAQEAEPAAKLGDPAALASLINSYDFEEAAAAKAEKALARAAKSMGIVEIISTNSGHPLADIVEQAPGYPFLFQLYLNKQKESSRELLLRVESLGCKAIFLTVDSAGRGKRESDGRLKSDETLRDPITGKLMKAGAGLIRIMGSFIDQGMTWKDLEWIRSVTKLPIILKGITSAEDAKIAMRYNVDGILLSNHGGRNLDYSPPTILLLLELHKTCPEIFDRMEIYVDGGFRRGADIIKALCLGAKAVGMGRSFLYTLNYGTEGVEHLIQLLKAELEAVMKLIGIKEPFRGLPRLGQYGGC